MPSKHRLTFASLLTALTIALPLSAATITVMTAADSGSGSLRAAIETANASAGADTINFAPALSGQTIHLLSDLPALTDNGTTINGDINADGKPDVALSGDQASITYGLEIRSANNTIQGLCINRCSYGIYVFGATASGNKIRACYLGTNLAGTAPEPNENYGIYINNAPSTTVGGTTAATRNVVSGNYTYGIYAYRAPNTLIRNLYCGLNASGAARIPNLNQGIYLQYCTDATIGYASSEVKTVVSGNGSDGIAAYYCIGLRVINTYCGAGAGGNSAIPNLGNGIYLYGCNSAVIGGSGTSQGNVLSGNTSCGLYAYKCYAGPTVRGNKIGTNQAGSGVLPNRNQGIYAEFCSNIVIGGNTAEARNLICGNESDGIYLSKCTDGSVKGNYVGVDNAGNADLRNWGDGIEAQNCTGLNIGGTTAAERNVIVADGYGVYVGGLATANVNVLNNYVGYGANGTTARPCGTGVYLSSGVRNAVVGATGAGNRILARGYGISAWRVGSGCKIVSNRIGAPVGAGAYGTSGIRIDSCAPRVDGNTVFQQSTAAMNVAGEAATPVITNNTFRKNAKGVYIESGAKPNLGDLGNASTNDNGNNTFAGNSDYDIYNITPNSIKAEGNTFASTSAETIDGRFIYDQLDDPRYGRVDYDPLKSGAPSSLRPLAVVTTLAAIPTSLGGAEIVVSLSAPADLQVEVMNIAGRPVRTWASLAGKVGVNALVWNGRSDTGTAVPSGAYLVAVTCRSEDGHQQRQVARVYLNR